MNEILDLTDKEKTILKAIAKEGPIYVYALAENLKLASIGKAWETVSKLKKEGLIAEKEPEKGKTGLERKPYLLTFKGLWFILRFSIIHPDEAATIIKKHGITPPLPEKTSEKFKASILNTWNIFVEYLPTILANSISSLSEKEIEKSIERANVNFFAEILNTTIIKGREEILKLPVEKRKKLVEAYQKSGLLKYANIILKIMKLFKLI